LAASDDGGGPGNAIAPARWLPPLKCPVTEPKGSAPPGERARPEFHGNGRLWTTLSRRGTFLVAPESAPEFDDADGGMAVDGTLLPNGSLSIKAPWWRGPGVRGGVWLVARRLDAAAPSLEHIVGPSGYGLPGHGAQPSVDQVLEGHWECGKRPADLRDAHPEGPP
jgi:hypothetical protein